MLYKDSRNSTHNITVEHKGMIKMGNIQKEVQAKLAKGLLDLIVLHSPPVPKRTTNARIPNNNKNTQKLRRLLRTINHIPTTRHTRKKRLRQQPMEHEQRKTKKNLQPNNRRTNDA